MGYLGARGVMGGIMDMESDGEASPTLGIHTNIEVACTPFCVIHLQGSMCGVGLMVSDGVSCKTWSQMCDSWYLPKFQLSEGSLTWMYIASFMFLVTPCDSLSTTQLW